MLNCLTTIPQKYSRQFSHKMLLQKTQFKCRIIFRLSTENHVQKSSRKYTSYKCYLIICYEVTKVFKKTFSTILSFLNLKALVAQFCRFVHFATEF